MTMPATPEWTVVHPAVVAFGIVTRIPAVQVQQTALGRTADHAQRGRLRHELGEQRDDVDAHPV
jgi:hypothetical protein